MNQFQQEYETTYKAMREASVTVEGELLQRLKQACQANPWLKINGIDFEDDLCMEHDYPYFLERYEDIAMLEKFFQHGNWAIRAAVQYKDLIFVNQVNGGDEWWTLKILPDGALLPFESITMRHIHPFAEYIERLHQATPEQCKALEY